MICVALGAALWKGRTACELGAAQAKGDPQRDGSNPPTPSAAPGKPRPGGAL